ncbi:hypothetical protein [Microcoleus sp. D2_18a_B4]|uniref:hypothetical protein n=1 Tax=Microcoleus sp. D2_18a_B4 TaxID=3055329 RepID=UPI002FD6726A
MKLDLIPEIVRSLTPCALGIAGFSLAVCAILNSERLTGDRFAYTLGVAGTFLGSAAGGYSPQNRQSQNRISADQVDIDQSK